MSWGDERSGARPTRSSSRRIMARPIAPTDTLAPRRTQTAVSAALVVVLGLLVIVGGASMLGGRDPSGTAPPSLVAAGSSSSARPSAVGATASPQPAPSVRRASPTPPPASARPTPRPTAVSSPTASSIGAPASASGFDLDSQVIKIGFPLRPETRYRYRDNYLGLREGAPQSFNHARLNAEGELVRLHDGIDIYARAGEPIVAPFNGVVIDPARRWRGWQDDRYGLTVAIVSEEPESAGYTAVLTHLERVWVDVGQAVERGQILGVLGTSGNAEGVDPQLHFELRAPFEIDWTPLGETRRIDAFNPYPSLVRADPNR